MPNWKLASFQPADARGLVMPTSYSHCLHTCVLLLAVGGQCAAQTAPPEATASAAELRRAIESGDNRFSTRLALARTLAAGSDVDDSIAELHSLLDKGYNPVEAVFSLADFQNVRVSVSFEALRRRLQPCVDGAYDNFLFTVGAWSISNDANMGNKPDRSEITAVADGCALYEKYWTSYGYEAESFKAYDQANEKWTMLVVDNQGFFLSFVQVPGGSDDGVVLEARDKTAVYRATSRQVDDNTFRVVWLWSRDDGITWKRYVDSEYHRNPALVP